MKKLLIKLSNSISTVRAPYLYKELNCRTKMYSSILHCMNTAIYTRQRFKNRILAREHLQNLKSHTTAPMALLIGNSPSSTQLNPQKIKELQDGIKLDVFVMNAFHKSSISLEINPNYIILSDPTHCPSNQTSEELWNWLKEHEKITVICPASWKSTFYKKNDVKNSVCFFNDDESAFKSKSINPTKPRTFPSLTALKGLAIAGFLKYKTIQIIGIDNSHFESLSCDSGNALFLGPNHNSSDYHSPINLSETLGLTTTDYFYDLSVIFKSFKLFEKLPILNLNPRSLVDSFEKDHKSELVLPEFWVTSDKGRVRNSRVISERD